jgi:hypothetical protein
MKKNILLLVFIGFFLSMAPLVFSLELNMLTPADTGQNSYYVSNYSTREINFSASHDFKSTEIKEGKIVYSYQVLPNSKGLDIQLSNTEVIFTNNFSNTEIIYLNTTKLTEIKNLQIKAEVFDTYNNLLFTKVLFFKIIPNNSNNYYEYTKTHSEPRYTGYSMSRSVAVINGPKDFDVISIYTKTEDNSNLSISCFTSNEAIVVEQQYQSPGKTDLNLTIDSKAKELKSGDYFIDCKLFNAYGSQELPEIKLRYTSDDISKDTEKDQNKSISITEKSKFATGFLSLPKPKSSSFTYVLFVILIILILLILFSRNSS